MQIKPDEIEILFTMVFICRPSFYMISKHICLSWWLNINSYNVRTRLVPLINYNAVYFLPCEGLLLIILTGLRGGRVPKASDLWVEGLLFDSQWLTSHNNLE